MGRSLTNLIEQYTRDHIGELNFSFASVALFDFQKKSFDARSFYLADFQEISNDLIYDLASLSKPLTLGLAKLLYPNIFDDNMDLLLNHRAGLPAYGVLSRDRWREHISSFSVRASQTCYSDYGALRTMLEFDNVSKQPLEKICEEFYPNLKFWLNLKSEEKERCVVTGERYRKLIQGEVHDPNAFNLKTFCSHAGLFGTIGGLANSLMKLEKQLELQKTISSRIDRNYRFVEGFDRATNTDESLAGMGCSEKTFGHLGFTGTCFWIDPEKQIGWSLLTNATESYWFERDFLNGLRRIIGKAIWSGMIF